MREFTRGGQGARYVKTDLHVHTPDSHDYREENVSPSDLVEALEAEGIELVALTDHNCSGWYDGVVEAAEEHQLTVLPGVEITTHYGAERRVHMTAVFPPEQAERVGHILSQIGIDETDSANQHASVDINEICRMVRSYDGLPILAHIDQPCGAHYEFDRNNDIKEELFNPEQIAALEIVDDETRDQFDGFPFIKSSDAHEFSELGRGFTLMKMTEPSFEGLRTALADPDSRIALESTVQGHASLDGVYCDGAFLQDREVQLNKSLNCLIGGKGTGKSTVIEFIRYALDIDPRSDAIQEEYEALVSHNLDAGGVVEVHLTAENGEGYVVRRELNNPSTVHRADGEALGMDIHTFREEFFAPEIHSQRELLNLAKDERGQLGLLDSYFDVEELKQGRDGLKDELRQNARQLAEHLSEREQLEGELTGIEAVRETISVMEDRGVDEYIDNQDLWESERRVLTRVEEGLQSAKEEVETLDIQETIVSLDSIEKEWPNRNLVEQVSDLADGQATDIEDRLETLVGALEETIEAVETERETWDDRNATRRAEYEELADEIEETTGVDIEDYFEQKEELERLEGLEEELTAVSEEIETLETKREQLLANLESARTELTDARQAGIARLNDGLNDVRVELQANQNKEAFIDWFDEVLRGSNLQTNYKRRVAEEYTPRELAQLIRERAAEQIEQEAGVTENTAETIVNYEPLREKVPEMEVMEMYDEPIIQLKDGSWKSLSEMSDGQKCTALLSIAMVERDTPLIIDQPEDMLDNDFIVSEVVEILREIKHNRQVVAVTHNANIPILGDAEQIVVMTSNGQQAFFTHRGSIDDDQIKGRAQAILEGGQQAFRRRDEKYRQAP